MKRAVCALRTSLVTGGVLRYLGSVRSSSSQRARSLSSSPIAHAESLVRGEDRIIGVEARGQVPQPVGAAASRDRDLAARDRPDPHELDARARGEIACHLVRTCCVRTRKLLALSRTCVLISSWITSARPACGRVGCVCGRAAYAERGRVARDAAAAQGRPGCRGDAGRHADRHG